MSLLIPPAVERRQRALRGGPVGAELGEARWLSALPTSRVLLITVDVELDAQTGWASVDHPYQAIADARPSRRDQHTAGK